MTGVLLAVRDKGSDPFGPDQVPLLASFADQAAVALEFAEKQRAQRLLDVLEDRDRIARDLHDHVIQRLFVTGLSLQGAMRRLDRTRRCVAGCGTAVEQLDQTVREIRTSIFDLHTTEDGTGLRRRLLDLVAELTEDDGAVARRCGCPAPSTTRCPTTSASTSRRWCARPSATRCGTPTRPSSWSPSRRATELVISVVDNGIGMPGDVARSGLRNLEPPGRPVRRHAVGVRAKQRRHAG